MSSIFNTQVNQYKKKYEDLRAVINTPNVIGVARNKGFTEETLGEAFSLNSKEFQMFVHDYAKSLMPGRVSCTTYAAVVGAIADYFNKSYSVYCGFCLDRNSKQYESNLKEFNEKKATEEHPIFATHVYLEADDGISYEFYNGNTSEIDHLDVVKIS